MLPQIWDDNTGQEPALLLHSTARLLTCSTSASTKAKLPRPPITVATENSCNGTQEQIGSESAAAHCGRRAAGNGLLS
jgi:hypothetical protein